MRLNSKLLAVSILCLMVMTATCGVVSAAPAKATSKQVTSSVATPVATSTETPAAISIAGKVAVVDVPKIVAESKQVKALKEEQINKSKELEKWLKTARETVEKQKTDAAKEKMLKKYETELAKKRSDNAKAYAQKLNAIDKSISDTIAAHAKANGYDVVLSKTTVLYGGDDITEAIAKIVK